MEEQEKQLEEEFDEIDAEFKALFTPAATKTSSQKLTLNSGRGADIGQVQFSAVEEETCSELDPPELASSLNGSSGFHNYVDSQA